MIELLKLIILFDLYINDVLLILSTTKTTSARLSDVSDTSAIGGINTLVVLNFASKK
ncbi:protein of unknown function [Clostridium beijerinckii]|nr:protein of unknown function [Clostridium beijerinckii]